MRKIVVIMSLLLACFVANAGELSFLKTQDYVKVIINYEKSIINGLTVDDYEDYERDWQKDQPVLYMKFISNFNDRINKYFVGAQVDDTEYTIEVRPITIDRNGNIKAYYVVLNSEGTEIYRSKTIHGSGGTFGSQLNLIGDGMERLGYAVAGDIKKRIK